MITYMVSMATANPLTWPAHSPRREWGERYPRDGGSEREAVQPREGAARRAGGWGSNLGTW